VPSAESRTDKNHVGAATAGDPYLPEQGNGGYRIAHYDLTLEYRMATDRLVGRAELTGRTTRKLARLSLDLSGLTVTKVSVNDHAARFAVRAHKLHVWPHHTLAADSKLAITVAYEGRPRPVPGPWGDVGWDQLKDGVIVASQPNGAASWFPCNDHPSAKATYHFRITTDSAYRVVCNGRLVDERRHGARTTWVFDAPEPMASYLATVQIGRYAPVVLAQRPAPQRIAVAPRAQGRFGRDFARQPRMMRLFEDAFGPYPFAAYTVVITDDDLEIPIEAQGLSVFGANHADGKRTYERLIAHELAHQWFGNSLTISAWRHIWLNEGFACYAEWLWSEACGGASADRHAVRQWKRVKALPRDFSVADPSTKFMFDDRLYKRGALALHALRAEMGDGDFFDLLRAWTKRNRHGSVDTDMFLALVQQRGGRPARRLLSSWLVEKRLPERPSRWSRNA